MCHEHYGHSGHGEERMCHEHYGHHGRGEERMCHEHHGHHGHAGGCCCEGGDWEWGHGRHHRRRFLTREERIARLEQYLQDLQAEIKAVEERLAEIKASA